MRRLSVCLALLVVGGCQVSTDDARPAETTTVRVDVPADAASVSWEGEDPTPEQIEAARLAGRGRQGFAADTAALAAAARANPETLESIGTAADWSAQAMHLPLGGGGAGPSVLKAQVLLSRAGFSPGEIDGRWGDNTELAVVAAQQALGLPPTGLVDAATARALAERAGRPASLVDEVALTADDVEGPFRALPSDVYARARLDRQGYESLAEKLGERFHASPALLERLNPGRDLDALTAGERLRVPAVANAPRVAATATRIEVSKEDGYLRALTDDGRIVFHAPVTVGADYDPSPDGDFRITNVARNPTWHYQPAILANVPSSRPSAVLPAGPNNAVGTVWMALSEPHYGIHGTSAPSTIGTATSAGCVRLTNWDVERLADLVGAGTPVRFRAPGPDGAPPPPQAAAGARPDAPRATDPRASRTD